MIKVGIDTLPLSNQSAFRGVGRYTKNLIEGLEKRLEIKVIAGKWEDIWQKVDLIHFPYFDLFFHTLPVFKKKKTVVTIHDCIPLVFPKYYSPGIKGKLFFYLQRTSLRSVNAVITDSESSKNDIRKFFKIPENKIYTIYLAQDSKYKKINISEKEKRETMEKYGISEDFVLYIGDVNYNKNIEGLVKSFVKVDKEYQLLLVGKAWENTNLPEVKGIKEEITKNFLEDRIKIVGFVRDEDLTYLYNLAAIYCQPSYYEGFGLQILEAMACGCPVVTANISSMPEISGNAAVLVNPYDIDDITKGINSLIENNSFRTEKIRLGYEQSKKFSWEKTLDETIKVYEKILL